MQLFFFSLKPSSDDPSQCLGNIFRELPNWLELKDGASEGAPSGAPEQRSGKETALIRSKIGGHTISAHEILGDTNQLRSIGLLQESMVRKLK